MSAFPLSQQLPDCQYRPLKADEIRLLMLQPGKPRDDLCFSLTYEHLVYPSKIKQTKTPLTQDLRRSLERKRGIFQTLESPSFFHRNSSSTITTPRPKQRVDPGHHLPFAKHTNPNFEPGYEALSYVWGSLQMTVTSYLVHEGSPMAAVQIGHNLATALRHLRYRDKPRALWVDAVCINQKDLGERSEQVARMALIYGLASRVIVWLGLERNNGGHALSMLQYVGEQIDTSKPGCISPSVNALEPQWYLSEYKIPFRRKTWRAIAAIYENPWWFRIWTLQEILVANEDAILQCGHHYMLFSTLRRATICLKNNDEVPQNVRHALFHISCDVQTAGNISLKELLGACDVRSCTDPRDRIYGILNVCPPQFVNKIRPQYFQSVFQVYKDVLLALVELSNRLDILTYLGNTSSEIKLPSWIPNWTNTEKATVYIDRGKSAAGLSQAQYHFIEPQALEVVGIRCGQVYYHTQPFPFEKSGLIDILFNWQPRNFRGAALISEIDYWAALRMGYFKDNYPESQLFPTARDWYKSCICDVRRSLQTLPDDHVAGLYGSSGFLTREGCMGFGPSLTQPGKLLVVSMRIDARSRLSLPQPSLTLTGDLLYVVLGCCAPLILRPSASATFTVIGPCYAHGFMNAEALLGRLPKPWVFRYTRNNLNERRTEYFNANTLVTADDPRLDSLHDDWGMVEKESNSCDLGPAESFKNRVTGKVVNYDPRLSLKALKQRKVPLETLRLV